MQPKVSDIENQKLILEKEKLQKEVELREKEIELKTKELSIKEQEVLLSKTKITPAQVTIIITVIGILGTLIATYFQNKANMELEQLKFQSNIILKVATSDNYRQNTDNLKWFLKSGILTDNDHKLINAIKDTSFKLKIEDTTTRNRLQGVVRIHLYNRNMIEISNVEVKLYPVAFAGDDTKAYVGRTDSSGVFIVQLPFGQYQIVIIKNGKVMATYRFIHQNDNESVQMVLN